jgi:hypothetical protein
MYLIDIIRNRKGESLYQATKNKIFGVVTIGERYFGGKVKI